MLKSMESQRVRHDWATELTWSCSNCISLLPPPHWSFCIFIPILFSTSIWNPRSLRSLGTPLVVQWLRRSHAPKAGGLGQIPREGIRSHMLQLKITQVTTMIRDPAAKTKIQHDQINKSKYQKIYHWLHNCGGRGKCVMDCWSPYEIDSNTQPSPPRLLQKLPDSSASPKPTALLLCRPACRESFFWISIPVCPSHT